MSINEIQNQIIEEFSVFTEWDEKYEYLIDIGKKLPALDSNLKTNENLIEGCQSRVWLNAELRDEKIFFAADSEAIITKGLIALLIKVLSNQTPQEIMNCEIFFIDKIGLSQNLSPTRANGLRAMLKQMKLYAMAFFPKKN